MKPTYLLSLVYLGAGLTQAAPLEDRNGLAIPNAINAIRSEAHLDARDPWFRVSGKPAVPPPSFWTFVKNKLKGLVGKGDE